MSPSLRRIAFVPLSLVALAPAPAPEGGPATRPTSPRAEALVLPDGSRLPGRLAADAPTGLALFPEGPGSPVPLGPGAVVEFEGPGEPASAGSPPFRLLVGHEQRISGRLGSVDGREVRLLEGPGGRPLAVPRGAARALIQRPGEVQVLRDGFESLDPARWSRSGTPETVDGPHTEGDRALLLPAGGTSLTRRLAEPVGTGRLELAYLDAPGVVEGQQCVVDLAFAGPAGPESVRVVLGWAEESLAVESPEGPALAVQHLARRDGWRRLAVRFGPGRTEVSVDGDELAHGKGPGGPLVEIRLATYPTGKAAPPPGLGMRFDDLTLARRAEPGGTVEVDATQDEVRLVGGNQVFGAIRGADPDRVTMLVDGREAAFSWGEVSGLHFRRVPTQAGAIEGLFVRVEWRSAADDDPGDPDRAEGALALLSDEALTLTLPFAGALTIPRASIRGLRVTGLGRRVVLDTVAHHLGDELSTTTPPLDPPWPEGEGLERTFTLDEPPSAGAALLLDVVQVAGEAPGLPFSDLVAKGLSRANVLLNGRPVDYLNRHIDSRNEAPERIRLPIPDGLLRAGENRLRIELTGEPGRTGSLDDLGVLGIALESPSARAPGGSAPSP